MIDLTEVERATLFYASKNLEMIRMVMDHLSRGMVEKIDLDQMKRMYDAF